MVEIARRLGISKRSVAEHGFTGAEVETITVTGTPRMIERHNILEPADLSRRNTALRSASH